MRPDRPQDVGEFLELRDDRRHETRGRAGPPTEPAHLGQVRRLVLLETDDYVIVQDLADAMSVARSLAGICVPYLVAEGLLSAAVQVPAADRDRTITVGRSSYAFHGGRWMQYENVPTGKVARSSRSGRGSGTNRRTHDVYGRGNWRVGSWDGSVHMILRRKEFRAAASEYGLPEDPTADWTCACLSGKEVQKWDTKKCWKCERHSPRAIAMGVGVPDANLDRQGRRGPETRGCPRCGGQVRVKRRSGKFVSASHARGVCNVQLVGRVLEM